MVQLDHTNRPVPQDETAETEIRVWRVDVKPALAEADYYIIRGWQDMLAFIRDHAERVLEYYDFGDSDDAAMEMKVSLETMTRGEYDEICDGF